jgi:seryl-tRNA synthetase
MLDINKIRENPDKIQKALLKRGAKINFTELLAWDKERRQLLQEVETLKAQKNQVSSQIPKLKKQGQDVTHLLAEMKIVSEKTKTLDEKLCELEPKIQHFLAMLPNIPADDVVAGNKENNQVISTFGQKPKFNFTPKDHLQLVTDLGLIDYERGVKMGGNGFWLYKGLGAQLEWALLNYFIETHLKDGYEFILPPHILNYQCGYTAGQFPKFEDDVYLMQQKDGQGHHAFMLPTAETALINYHRDEIIPETELPKKYFAYTPCYRKEAGSYRAAERGMIRGHQFNKIEMFQFTKPEHSNQAHQELIKKACGLVEGLGLHYQLSKLAAADVSEAMTTTYDIEIWIPSMNDYKEASSVSNSCDYQSRRGNIRFKNQTTGKNEFIHSLNGSGLATSRLLPAIVEQFQQPDGSVLIPEVLHKFTGFDKINPTK